MTTMSYAREADRLTGEAAGAARPLDLTGVTGDWISVTGLGGGVALIRARAGDDGALTVSVRGQGEPRPGEWGEVPADAFANALRSTECMAFTAHFDGPEVSSTLESYQAVGVLTGHTFHRFTDGSGRRDYFTREFYVPAAGQQPVPCGEFPAALQSGRNDPGKLLGTWTGLAPDATKSIATLECEMADGDFAVRAEGVGADGPVDWGTTPGRLYADAAYPDYPPAFLATFDHGYMRVHLQARINRGVLVVCEFTQFTDGSGRSDYFIRECYRR
ncbi:MAG TPA: hypothetical protein VFU43_19190 [Streptosporangiaceae bacterium]|nr:hypothetical protein [Streptosporangiaceae bacterium]